jgi:hypothetical protein
MSTSEGSPPLRLPADCVPMYAMLLAVISSLPFILIPSWFRSVAYRGDIANFWSAGATVGTTMLANVTERIPWQLSQRIDSGPFVYPPGFAWIYAPLAHLPPIGALVAEELAMTAIFILAAAFVARIYAFPLWFAIATVFAWGPTLNAIEVGQNTGLALLFTLGAIGGLLRSDPLLSGLSVGLLLYKPTDALPLILLLGARRQYRALGIVAACGALWYLVSVPATHGDWLWPSRYVQTIQQYYAHDFHGSAYQAFTLPTLLLAFGAPYIVAIGAAGTILLFLLILLPRVPVLEAGSMAGFVGLCASLHAWTYDGSLLLPGLCYAMTRLPEPLRTRLIVAAYVVAGVGGVMPHAGHSLALVCLSGTLLWFFIAFAHLRTTFARRLAHDEL